MRVVVDASVAVKWALPEVEREPDVPQALQLLAAIRDGRIEPIQPPHWLAEVAAVVTRLRPRIVEPTIDLLDALELPVVADVAIYRRASRLSAVLDHHLFDTLYHAVALERDAVLVSADARYVRKARSLGAIATLAGWDETPG